MARGVALQGDGKIVVVGGGGSGADFALARYNTDGSLDTSFSGDGKLTTDFGSSDAGAAVAVQGDGKIVAVGGSAGDFALARYNPNGSLDTSFSGDGKQTTDFGGFGQVAAGVALQGDGKIVVAGNGGSTGNSVDFALARYNTDGSLDTSFSGDGKQKTDFGDFDVATGVALQADGKIVAVGVTRAGGGDFALARYNPNGSLDTSFSGDGKQTTDFGGSDGANGVVLQGDGKIIAVGDSGAGDGDFALARYNTTGRSTPASPAMAGRRSTSGASAIRPAGSTLRTRWCYRRTAGSSRSGPASARTNKPTISGSLAFWEAERSRSVEARAQAPTRCTVKHRKPMGVGPSMGA